MSNASAALPLTALTYARLMNLVRALLNKTRSFLGVPAIQSITTDQMETVMTATRMAMSGHIFNTIIASIALAYSQPNLNWLVWSFFSSLLAAHVFRRRKVKGATTRRAVSQRALNRAILFGVLLALPWAVLPVLYLDPSDQMTMVIIIALVTGMSASGGILLAPVFPAAFCYVAAIILPTFAVILSLGTNIEFVLLSCLAISYGGFLFATISIVARLSIVNSLAKNSLRTAIEKIEKTTAKMDDVLEPCGYQANTTSDYLRTNNILKTLERSSQKLIDQEDRLRKSEAGLSSLLNTAMDAIISTNPHGRIDQLNPAALRMFEIDDSEKSLPSVKDLISEMGWQKMSQQLRRTDTNAAPSAASLLIETEGRRRSGETFPIELSLAGAGADGHTTLIVRDTTQRKNSETKLHLLIKEVNHRSRNLMAVLSSICGMTAARAKTIEEFSDKFSARMRSLMQSQELITADGWAESPIRALINLQLKIYAHDNPDRITTRGPDISLQPKAVQNLGLALHELATNSAKYGALSAPSGAVQISWRVVSKGDQKSLVLIWRERNGPPVASPATKGFGTILLQKIIAQDLNGSAGTKYRKKGLVWQARIDQAYFKLA